MSVRIENLSARLTEDEIGQIEETTRLKTRMLPIVERRRSFEEIELGSDEKRAVLEAKRCLRCWTRIQDYDSSTTK